MRTLLDWFRAPHERYRTADIMVYVVTLLSVLIGTWWLYYVLIAVMLVKAFYAWRRWMAS